MVQETGIFSFIEEQTRNDKVAVSTSSVTISDSRNAANPRKNIVIRNTSPNAADIITINIGFSTAVSSFGIVLNQNEAFSDSSESGYQCAQGTISAVCATVNGQLSIYER